MPRRAATTAPRPAATTRRSATTAAAVTLAALASPAAGEPAAEGQAVPFPPNPAPEASVKKLTPILTVEAIEPCLPFWTERLGFEVTVTVPAGDALGFAILARDGVEVMYQTRASLEEDLPDLAEEMMTGTATLFVEVEAIDPLEDALEGAEVVVPRRRTFYGMDEVFVRAPCGTIVGFAAPVDEGEGEGPEG